VVERHLEQRRQGRVSRNVAADAGVVLVLAHHHGHRVPADEAFDAALHGAIARIGDLVFGANGVDVWRILQGRQIGAGHPRLEGSFSRLYAGRSGPASSITWSSASIHSAVSWGSRSTTL